ncbi:transcriptional regulator [Moorella thermoacetica]|uniref:Transcriptional regulator, XRE family n=1 Tax=Moorella thermoacetica (strain ATCC 39073 / JCM 9320) TaxID=264732 RepID=Q2RLS1_MOOTA|nr:helix-turn-helix transcriptional regulator [Moorella thermoacetica]AKX95668.1 HTH-type transcriptional regulator PuuR [Moorella thermoacetica]OIQ53500.1 HTH-type transcriptional regulator PuuR [Moorella thermoacetica]QCZ99477.1 HTH-type transcriptional regulator PuuR [Moorella thermoacetica]TYL07657.1 hypothetical protein MOOCA_20020 [Moorella thermoacetica]TYL07925.1 hypothetical protein MOLA_21720 [Moorella thermoacetica]
MTLGNRLKELREKHHLTQYRLAKLSGVSQSHISEIESGDKEPTTGTLMKICSAMGLTLAEFFTEETPSLPPDLRQILKEAESLTPGQRQKLIEFLKSIKSN